jgi:hypothetical protein
MQWKQDLELAEVLPGRKMGQLDQGAIAEFPTILVHPGKRKSLARKKSK